jgi:hypothetical protein
MAVHRIHRLSTRGYPPSVDNHPLLPLGYPQAVEKSWGWPVDDWGQRWASSTDPPGAVYDLLKVLGKRGPRVGSDIHRSGEKVGG